MTEPLIKQKITLQAMYGYKGAACLDLTIEEEYGWIKVFNNYNELMFAGGTKEFVNFTARLLDQKLA